MKKIKIRKSGSVRLTSLCGSYNQCRAVAAICRFSPE